MPIFSAPSAENKCMRMKFASVKSAFRGTDEQRAALLKVREVLA